MRILSIAVGKPQTVQWQNKEVLTSIFKKPVNGPVQVLQENLEGDEASDKRVHGGANKAVYAFSREAYDWWRQNSRFQPQTNVAEFGENLTVEGLKETEIHTGDIYLVGTAKLQVTAPRYPCFKLGIKFGSLDIVKEFTDSPFSGVYFRVLETGTISAGDEFKLLEREPGQPTIAEVYAERRNRKK